LEIARKKKREEGRWKMEEEREEKKTKDLIAARYLMCRRP
jgi:hypothetical protein